MEDVDEYTQPFDLDDIGYPPIGLPRPSEIVTPAHGAAPVETSGVAHDAAPEDYGAILARVLTRLSEVQTQGQVQMRDQHAANILALNAVQAACAPVSAADIGEAVRDAISDSVTNVVTPALRRLTFTTRSTRVVPT